MAKRIDKGTLKPPTRLPDGRLIADAYITRSGVFMYHQPDGTTRREYRPPEEVFKPESLATFALVPVTDDHPPDMINSANAREYAVGSTGETVKRDDNYVALRLSVFDQRVITKMDMGKVQISAGYDCTMEEIAGMSPEGEPYDAIQRDIVANHVAIVHLGRAGAGASVRMDATSYQIDTASEVPPGVTEAKQGQNNMDPILVAKLAEAAAVARADAAEKEALKVKADADAAKVALEKVQAERDALQAKADQADKARTDAVSAVPAQIAARVDLLTKAAFLGIDLSKMSDRQVKEAVIKKLDSVDVAADKTDAYVDAYFDLAISKRVDTANALGDVRVAGETTRADASKADADPEKEEQAKMLQRNRDAWKAPANKGAN